MTQIEILISQLKKGKGVLSLKNAMLITCMDAVTLKRIVKRSPDVTWDKSNQLFILKSKSPPLAVGIAHASTGEQIIWSICYQYPDMDRQDQIDRCVTIAKQKGIDLRGYTCNGANAFSQIRSQVKKWID
jgi:hypothetical protein